MRQKLLLAAGCLVCVAVGLKSVLTFEGTEFSGGTLFRYQGLAINVLILALILTIRFSRIASALALIGAILSIPVYLYLTFPGPFIRAWGGEWSVMSRQSFVWNLWWVLGVLASTFVIVLSAIHLLQWVRAAGPKVRH